MTTAAFPVIRWAGGKSGLLSVLLPWVPFQAETYYEPFAGGAALFFAVAHTAIAGHRRIKRYVLADQNADLIATYRAIQTDVEGLIAALDAYVDDEDLYYEVRSLDPERLSDVARGARMLFLNRTCFNGLWRVNARGRFNVPYGRRDLPRVCHELELRAAAALFQKVEVRFVHGDFRDVLAGAGPGDFIYADPPYVPLSKTSSFSRYARRGFTEEDHRALRETFADLRSRGARVLVSNSDTAATRELYEGAHVVTIRAPRSIASRSDSRGDVDELLVTYGPVPE